jgi:hypothetical protein
MCQPDTDLATLLPDKHELERNECIEDKLAGDMHNYCMIVLYNDDASGYKII